MSDQQNQPKYVVHNAVQSAVGDYANVNNYLPAQTTALDAGSAELRRLFEQVNERLAALPVDDREDAAPLVEKIVEATAAIQQGDESEEKQSFLQKRLTNLYKMAPDIGELIITALVSPAAGVALTIKKVAQKAKESLRSEE